MRNYLTILIILLFIATNSVAQKRSAYFELLGSGGLGSMNYEQVFYQKSNYQFTWRAGLSVAPIDKNNGVGIIFPLLLNTRIGKQKHKLELGIGQGVTITTKGHLFILAPALLGYRYEPVNKSLFYRVSYTPLISYIIDFQVQNWLGLSVGYTFKN